MYMSLHSLERRTENALVAKPRKPLSTHMVSAFSPYLLASPRIGVFRAPDQTLGPKALGPRSSAEANALTFFVQPYTRAWRLSNALGMESYVYTDGAVFYR